MLVGYNYPFPWNAYGIYLGSGNPCGSQPSLDRWPDGLTENLSRLRDLGVSVVRIFLFCNAANYGSITKAGFLPPRELDARVVEQVRRMLRGFEATGLRVIPSLLDFKAFGRAVGDNGAGDRSALATDAFVREVFVETVVTPLLEAGRDFRGSIYAWEVMNEPVWTVLPFLPASMVGKRRLSVFRLASFLRAVLARIESPPFSFQSTVGHRFASDLSLLPTGTLRQFHFYPARHFGAYVIDRTLPFARRTRAFIGELGTHGGDAFHGYPHGHPYRELRGRDERGPAARVLERLALAREKGYSLALLWPDLTRGPHVGQPDTLKLSAEAERGLAEFSRS